MRKFSFTLNILFYKEEAGPIIKRKQNWQQISYTYLGPIGVFVYILQKVNSVVVISGRKIKLIWF